MDEKRILNKSDKIVTREVEGEVIMIPLYKSSEDLSYIYTLNETAARFWKLIDGKRTISAIKKKILSEYEITEEKLSKQIGGLLKDLNGIKAFAK